MSTGSTLKVGDVVLIDVGETVGSETKMKRPWLIVAIPTRRKNSSSRMGLTITVPMTRTKRNWWTVVKIADESYALCHQIRSMSTKRVTRKLDRLDEKTVIKIRTVVFNLLFHPHY